MLKRLIVGLLLGTVVGAVVAAVLVQGLGMWSFAVSGAVFAYLAAAVTGVLTGLVAGKPIWSADGKIEAGLKAFFGALLALGAMFALRTWAKLDVDLTSLKAGRGLLGDLPAASLPIVAAVLAGFFELDNTGESKKEESEAKGAASKGAESGKKVRVADEEEAAEEEEEEAPAAKKKAR
jgi:hypothetical protein